MDRNVAFALIVAASLTGLMASKLIEAPPAATGTPAVDATPVERPQYKPNDIRYRFQVEEERRKRRTKQPAPLPVTQ